jgi:hypothetical protein
LYERLLVRGLQEVVSRSRLPDEILRFIQCLFQNFQHRITDDHITVLCTNRYKFGDFFDFMQNILVGKEIFPHWIEVIAGAIDPTDFSERFFEFMEHMVQRVNLKARQTITSLPLHCEDTLWRFSLIETPFRQQFAFLLCQLYASNDDIHLKDQKMIETFIARWRDRDCARLEFKIELLGLFLDATEGALDRDLRQTLCLHRFDLVPDVDVKIRFPEQQNMITYRFQNCVTIGSVVARIVQQRGFLISAIELVHRGVKLPRSDPLSKYVKLPKKRVTFEVRFMKGPRKLYHVRHVLPSILIAFSPWIFHIFNQIATVNGWVVHEFLKKLPLLECAPKIVQFWNHGEQILTQQYFPLSAPCLFSYNFITLLQHLEFSLAIPLPREWLCDAVSFMIYQIEQLPPSDAPMAEIIREFMHFLEVESNLLNDFPTDIRIHLFSFLVRLLQPELDPDLSRVIQDVLSHICQRRVTRFRYHDEYCPLIEFLLFHTLPELRAFGLSLFSAFIIPVRVFVNRINFSSEITPEFIAAITEHLSDDFCRTDMFDLSEMLLSIIEIVRPNIIHQCLCLLRQLLESNEVPEPARVEFVHRLIPRFLSLSSHPPDPSAFEVAAECLASLSNTRVDGRLLLCEHLADQHVDRRPMNEFLQHPAVGEDCSTGEFRRVGLIGCPSHFNAVIQQVFALKPIRNAIMRYDGFNPFIHKFSRFFFFLRYSESKAISAESLILNEPVSHDPYEFLFWLLDVLSELFCATVLDFPVENPPFSGVLFVRINQTDIIPELSCGLLSFIGVVLRRTGQQYCSIVSTKRGWLSFDDDRIASADITTIVNPILLVYTLPINNEPAPRPPYDLANEIERRNELNRSTRLFCSRGYHRLMERIAAQTEDAYLSVCLRYAVDTLPFSHTGLDSGSFFEMLIAKLCSAHRSIAADYLHYLLANFFIPCIFVTILEPVRQGHASLIERALLLVHDIDPTPFAEDLLTLFPNCQTHYCQIDELFRVLLALHSQFRSVRDLCIRRGVKDSMIRFLTVKLPEQVWQARGEHSRDYYQSLDLTHALLVALAVDAPTEEPYQSPHFLSCLLRSKTASYAIARFALASVGKDMIRQFVIEHANTLSISRAISLMFHAIPECAIELSLSTHFRIDHFPSQNMAIGSCFLAMADQGVTFECLLFFKLTLWLAPLLFDESALARFNAVMLIADIVRTEQFGEKYRKPSRHSRVEDSMTPRRASYVLTQIVAAAPDLAEKLTLDSNRAVGEHRADAYLHALAALLSFAYRTQPLTPLRILYHKICTTQKHPFSLQSTDCLQILADRKVSIDFNLLILPFLQIGKQSPKSFADDLCRFVRPLFMAVSLLRDTRRFVPIFLDFILFQKWPLLNSCTHEILAFLRKLARSDPGDLILWVDRKLGQYGADNVVMLVQFCEILQIRRPFLQSLTEALQNGSLDIDVNVNDLIPRVLETVNITPGDQERLQSLLRRDDVNEGTRAHIEMVLKFQFPGPEDQEEQ